LKNEVFTDYWRQGRTFGHDFEQLLHIRKKWHKVSNCTK
jgi:hypothetical protein